MYICIVSESLTNQPLTMKSYFSISELLNKCSDQERQGLYKSAALSRNLSLLSETLQGIRELLGMPLVVNSSYRDEQHNKAAGGVRNSQHLSASAADITCKSLGQLLKAIKEYQAKTQRLGQVIVYDSFIHVALAEACNEEKRAYQVYYK